MTVTVRQEEGGAPVAVSPGYGPARRSDGKTAGTPAQLSLQNEGLGDTPQAVQ